MTETVPSGVAGDGASALDAALLYASLGWRVLPIKPGHKRPPMESWQHAATTDADVIANWYNGLYAGHGVGIATGAASGVFVLDVDVSGEKRGDESLADLEAAYGPLPDTVRAITGTNGLHLFFAVPEGVDIRNNASTRLGAGLDIRGEGGQVVAAPTVHPNGRAYTWEMGFGPDEIEVAAAPGWLVHLLTTTPTPAAPPERQGIPLGNEDSIAEHIRRTHDWHGLLYGDGWTQGRSSKAGETLWTRPGKPTHEGASAVLHEPDGPLVVFSTDASLSALHRPEAATRDGSGFSYSLFGYIAATRHGGDRSACASAYRQALSGQQAQIVTSSSSATAHAVLTGTEVEPSDDDWQPIDLAGLAAAIRAGTHQPIAPTVLAVEGSSPLFYPARINSLFGESGGGKTWVSLAAVAEVVSAGECALVIDYEDNAAGIAERLVLLGLSDEAIGRVRYLNPSTSLGLGVDALERLALSCALVVLDSTGEAMAAGGTNPNADEEVARWFVLVKHLCRLPGAPAVVVLDHVPKDKDAPSAYAIGSQRKRAAVTGAAYRVDTLKEPAKGRDGRLRLTVAKDRPGNRAKGTTAALVEMTAGAGGTLAIRCHITDAQAAAESGVRFRPTVYMEKVSRWLEINPKASKRRIYDAIKGKRDVFEIALEVLVEEGFAAVEDGPRGSLLYSSVGAFRELQDGSEAVDNPDSGGSDADDADRDPPRPDRDPTATQNGGSTATHRDPPLLRGRGGGSRSKGRGPRPESEPVDNSAPILEMF